MVPEILKLAPIKLKWVSPLLSYCPSCGKVYHHMQKYCGDCKEVLEDD